MKRLKVLTALTMGIMASSSGMLQTEAAIYTFNVNFTDKQVTDFDDFNQTYLSTTYDLGASITFTWAGVYSFASCPAPLVINIFYESYWELNLTGVAIDYNAVQLPDFVCSTSLTTYSVTHTTVVTDPLFVQSVIDDDANFVRLQARLRIGQNASTNGLQLRLHDSITTIRLDYDFNTTYLFNYFLSDNQFENETRTGTWSVGTDVITRVDYVYTTAGNDEYRLVNTDVGSVGNVRKKYAIDYNQEFFRGESIGARISRARTSAFPYTYDQLTMGSSGNLLLGNTYRYYYLNSANDAQAIVDAPIFEFEEEDCGSFLALNVGCFINNAFAYITNDAPIVSDAFTLLNAGIEMAAQTFGIIGSFADDNVFGVLILAGFGFIAVKWFLKND
jgi:hypothetical protein